MQAHNVILKFIGEDNLVGFAARSFSHGGSDRKTHYGYVQFLASNQPKINNEVLVRIELALNDTCTIRVFKDHTAAETIVEKIGVSCEELLKALFEIFG